MSDIVLFVNKQKYSGWTEASVTKSIKAVSGSFNLNVTNKWSGQREPWIIKPLDECELKLLDTSLITGFVDKITSNYDGATRSIQVSGRDKTADLVDCSYMGPTSLNGITFLAFLKKVCEPFKINVTSEITLSTKTDNFEAQKGETCYEFMERAARLRGYLLSADVNGDIVISKLGQTRAVTALIEGENVIDSSFDFDATQRFSEYIVKGQVPGDDEFYAEQAVSIKGSAKDPDVLRYRPLLLSAEGKSTNQGAKDRATWESVTRAAKSSRITATVKGWTQGDGSLWRHNQIVHYSSTFFSTKLDLLISEITYSISENGTKTTMVLERSDAYKGEPLKEKKSVDLWKELNNV